MLQIEIKSSFVELGNFLRQFSEEGNVKSASVLHNDLFFDNFANLIELSQSYNGWFTPEQVQFSVQSWSKALTEDKTQFVGLSLDDENQYDKTDARIEAWCEQLLVSMA